MKLRPHDGIRPLSPGVLDLLQSLPPGIPPDGLKTRILAAHARRDSRSSDRGRGFGLRRMGLALASGSLAAVAVFGLGAALRPEASAETPAWETVHPMPSASLPRVRVIDDPRLSLGVVSPGLGVLDPQDGP